MTRADRKPARPTRTAIALAIGAALVSIAPAAQSQSSDPVGARTLFAEARKLAAAGNYAQACPKFEDSYKLDPGIGTQFNLADCWEHIGRTASAWAQFLDVAARSKVEGQGEREKVARGRAAALEPRLSRLTIKADASDAHLEVVKDGVPVARSLWGTASAVDPGSHVIEAKAPSKKPWKTTVEVAANGAAATVTVPALEAAPEATALVDKAAAAGPSSAAAPAKDAVETTSGSSGTRTTAFILGGAGIVAIGVGGVFAALTKSEDNAAAGLCTDGPAQNRCSNPDQKAEYEDHVRKAKTDVAVAYAGFGGGAALLATAAILYFTSKPSTGAATLVTPTIARDGAGVRIGGSW
jgi:serine/threonine-protein kinase